MKIVDTGDPGVLSLKSGPVGCFLFAGDLLIIIGGLALSLMLGFSFIKGPLDPDLARIAIPAGFFLVGLGLILLGARRGMIIDGRSRSITSWWGVFAPLRRREQILNGYDRVVLTREVHRSKNTSTTLFPVRLEGENLPAVHIDAGKDYLKARSLAEGAAKTLRLSMTDMSSGKPVVRQAEHLDESLRDQFRREGREVEVLSQPNFMKSQVQAFSDEVIIEIPGLNARHRLILMLLVIIVISGIAAAFFGPHLGLPTKQWAVENWPFLIFLALFVGIPLRIILVGIWNFNRDQRITANQATLKIVKGNVVTEIPGDELEELFVSGQDLNTVLGKRSDGMSPAVKGAVRGLAALSPRHLSILARSDHASVQFADGLEADEINYLYSIILKVMVD